MAALWIHGAMLAAYDGVLRNDWEEFAAHLLMAVVVFVSAELIRRRPAAR